jgi:hypothetical protein
MSANVGHCCATDCRNIGGYGLPGKSKFMPALRLTDQQKQFVSAVATGVEAKEAARRAGYTSSSAAFELLHTESIEVALIVEMGRLMRTIAAPLAIKVGIRLLESEKTSERVREGLVKTFLDRTGFPAERPTLPDRPGDKALHEMSADDLRRYISRLESELADRAKPVITLPVVPAPTPNPIDIFE